MNTLFQFFQSVRLAYIVAMPRMGSKPCVNHQLSGIDYG